MKARFAFFCAVAAAAVLAACGGGGGGGGTPPTSNPTSTPTTRPTGAVTQNVTFSATASSTALPANAAGIAGTLAVPGGSGTATFTYAAVPPSPGPVAIAARQRDASTATSNTGVVYLTVTAKGNVTMNGVPGVTATLPSGAPAATFFVAYYGKTTGQTPAAQQAAWVSTTSGSANSGGSVSIPAVTTPHFTLANGQSVYLVLYYGYYIPPINILGCVGVQGNAARPQLVGVEPPANGSTWAYTGSLTQSIVRSSPCPIATPAVPASAHVTVDVTVTAAPTAPATGYVDEHSVESDAFSTRTTQVTTDAIVNGILESKETSVDLTGNAVVTTYGGSGLTYAPPSFQNNYRNAPPATVNTTFADGTTYARAYKSSNDGAYTETDKLAGITSIPTTITVNSNGSAAYAITNVDPVSGARSTLDVTMAAPSGGNIAVNFGGSKYTVPAWFTGGAALYSDLIVQNGVKPLDAKCGSGAQLGGGSGNQFVRTIVVIDPALGYTETRTLTSYVVTNYLGSGKSVGPVCVVIDDTQKLYYDFLLDVPFSLYYTSDGNPLQVSTLSESFAFSSTPVGYTRVRSAAETAAAAMNLALRASAIPFERTVERAQRLEQLERTFAHSPVGGVR